MKQQYLIESREKGTIMAHDKTDEIVFTLPTAPMIAWDQLTSNEQAWIEFIRIISCGTDPRITPKRVRALRELLDAG